MRKIILFVVTASMICFNNACYKADETQPFVQSAEELYDQLETAFQLSSIKNFSKFFMDWNILVPYHTAKFIEQDNVAEVIYEIYKEFYKPLDLLRLGNWEWGNNLNSNSEYVVVQNKIEFAILKEELFDIWFRSDIYESIKFETIDDFRPPVNLAKDKILYLMPEYAEALNMFLGTEIKDDTWERRDFIRPYIPILVGHWGGYWHLATHPEVSRILLDTNKTTAKVYFRVGYQGGEAILKKKENRWVIEESRATWIE